MPDTFAGIVLGAGPAGLGPLVCALQRGEQAALLQRGIAWIEARPWAGHGSLGDHAIDSDTAAGVLLECLAGTNNPLAALACRESAQAVRRYGTGSLPLRVAARFLHDIGEVAAEQVSAHPPSCLLRSERALRIVALGHERFVVETSAGRQLHARSVVLALGGWQDRAETLSRTLLPGLTLIDSHADRCMLTGELFAHDGLARARERLEAVTNPQVVIIGSSHSAVTAAHLLRQCGIPFGPRAITLVSRRPPKIFYPDADQAHADGYRDFDERDICPTTGRVFRLGGLRMAARDLLRGMAGLGGLRPDPRLQLLSLVALSLEALQRLLAEATLIVPAFGYRPRTLPVHDPAGQRIALQAEAGPRNPLVDARCRVLRADGSPLPGLYGIGLASGFVPRGPTLGGEPSFDGQTNGLWLYQNGVGRIVLDHLMAA